MKKKVIVRLFGGLGNQLFIYACARRFAFVSGAELVLDDVSGFINDHVYQRRYQLGNFDIRGRKANAAERMEPFPRLRRYFMRSWNGLLPFEWRNFLVQQYNGFDSRILNIVPRGTVYLEGYWQSQLYFIDVEAQIRDELKIAPPSDSANQGMAAHIMSRCAVAVHVRFFDAPNEIGMSNASDDYYARAVEAMECMAPAAHYFIFSDKPEAARARIPLPDDRVTLVVHNQGDEHAYADLWLMTLCQHFIIANSTFSWWGAWLASNPAKQIIAPGFEIRHGKMSWGFEGLLPDQWIKL